MAILTKLKALVTWKDLDSFKPSHQPPSRPLSHLLNYYRVPVLLICFFKNQTAHSPGSYYTQGKQSADHKKFLENQKDGNRTVVAQCQFYRVLSVRSETLYIPSSFFVIRDKNRQHSGSNGVALCITLLHKVL